MWMSLLTPPHVSVPMLALIHLHPHSLVRAHHCRTNEGTCGCAHSLHFIHPCGLYQRSPSFTCTLTHFACPCLPSPDKRGDMWVPPLTPLHSSMWPVPTLTLIYLHSHLTCLSVPTVARQMSGHTWDMWVPPLAPLHSSMWPVPTLTLIHLHSHLPCLPVPAITLICLCCCCPCMPTPAITHACSYIPAFVLIGISLCLHLFGFIWIRPC